tara:strand:- start:121 stop:360 length:240 start_codon:yes stop_codon:yes gene_type:complete
MSTVEESIIETQRKIIGIQDELNSTNDSIINLLKIDNARLTEELDTLHKEFHVVKKKLYDIQHFLDDTSDDLSTYVGSQ